MHSRDSSEKRIFSNSLQISWSDNVGHPYQSAINGNVNAPSMTNAVRQTNRPRCSHLCIRAYGAVVPSGRLSTEGSFIGVLLGSTSQSAKISRLTLCRYGIARNGVM